MKTEGCWHLWAHRERSRAGRWIYKHCGRCARRWFEIEGSGDPDIRLDEEWLTGKPPRPRPVLKLIQGGIR